VATGNVVALLGGLGNQLFQVAFGRWLEQQTGGEVWYDISFHRNLAVDVLEFPGIGERLREQLLTVTRWWPTPDGRAAIAGRLIRKAANPRRIVCDYSSPGLDRPSISRPAWWFGYWQRIEYAEVLLPELGSLLDQGRSRALEPVIGVHIRRGDILRTPSEVPTVWFRGALERLRTELGNAGRAHPVVVWSDDPDWCRSELDLGMPFEIAPGASAVEHLAALSRCSALVISRSTFSWWAARLATSRGAIVAYPKPWRSGSRDPEETVVSGWLGVPLNDGRSVESEFTRSG
jgi:hypothetical protein